jgi:hypothetical protein
MDSLSNQSTPFLYVVWLLDVIFTAHSKPVSPGCVQRGPFPCIKLASFPCVYTPLHCTDCWTFHDLQQPQLLPSTSVSSTPPALVAAAPRRHARAPGVLTPLRQGVTQPMKAGQKPQGGNPGLRGGNQERLLAIGNPQLTMTTRADHQKSGGGVQVWA